MNIYELSKELQDFFDSLPDTGELDEEALARYAELNDMTQDKLKSTAYAYLNLKAQLEGVTSEYKRIEKLKKSLESQAERVKKLIVFGMELIKSDKQDFGNVKLSFTPSVVATIVDESLVPKEFIKTEYKVDLAGAKEVLKNGGKVAGIRLDKKSNLQIK